MYTQNGMVCAGEPEPILKVCGVRALGGHRLWVRFNNGEARTLDLTPLLEYPAFAPLKEPAAFAGVYIDYGCPVWNDGAIDLSPDYLYEHGVAAEI